MFELFSKCCSCRRWMVLHPSRQNKHIQALVQCDNSYLFSQACMCKQNKQTHTCNTPFTPYTDKHSLSSPALVIMDVHILNHSDNYSPVFVYQSLCVLVACSAECFPAGGGSDLERMQWKGRGVTTIKAAGSGLK